MVIYKVISLILSFSITITCQNMQTKQVDEYDPDHTEGFV